MLRVLGRVCFSLVFLWSAVHLARHTTAAGTLAVGHYAAAVCAAVGVLLLLSDWQPRSGAMLLAALLLPATYLVDVVPLSAVRRSASRSPSFSQLSFLLAVWPCYCMAFRVVMLASAGGGERGRGSRNGGVCQHAEECCAAGQPADGDIVRG